MLEKEKCVPGTTVVVNKKVTQWNDSIGAKHNGLVCQEEKDLGSMTARNFELLPGTFLEITSKVKRCKFASSAKYVAFKVLNVDGVDRNTKFASFWISFKHKVD